MSKSIPLVNAYWSGDNIVVVTRAEDGRKLKAYPAEYSCFLQTSAVSDTVSSKLRAWPKIRSWKVEGDWIRVGWHSWRDLKEATSKSRYPHETLGGTESLFERLGLTVFEADVYPVRRFLTEHDVEIQRPRRCYLDLETDSRVPFGRKEDARILSWVVVDHDTGDWVGDILPEDTDAAEASMLKDIWEALEQYDQVAAWNGDRFDFPVLKARTEQAGIRVAFAGWLWIDHLEIFKSMNMHVSESGDEKQSFALGRIATAVLGETKDDLDASKTWERWAAGGESREALFRYNVRDSDLLRLIELETGYLDTQLVICQVCHTLPDSRGSNGTNFVEGYLLKMGRAEGLRFRSNWDYESGDRFEGAFVMEPTRKGLLRGIHVADFSGMYPSIIQTWNISPETIRADDVTVEDAASRPAYLKHLPPKTYPLPDDVCQVPGGCCFQKAPLGLIPRAIAELKRLRKHWNDVKSNAVPGTPEWHDAGRKSNAYKVAANTFYGVMGAPSSRFYDKRTASAVTAAGRWLIRETMGAAEKRGMSGIYGDTDSTFISDVTEAEFRAFVDWCNVDFYPSLLADLHCPVNEIRIAYEKEFDVLVLVGKKRYAGRFAHYKGTRATAESKPEVKGLEYKRGDTVKLARDLQYEVIQALMTGDERPETYDAIAERWRARIVDGQLVPKDFVLSKTLSKDVGAYAQKQKKDGTNAAQPPHVEIAKILKARGFDTGEGARVEYVVVDGSATPLKAIPVADYTDGAEDRFYLWEQLVWPATERVLECAIPVVKWSAKYGSVRPKKARAAKVIDPAKPAAARRRRSVPEEQGKLF
jgi:DNA polymerase elongation subunit (family B)